MSLPTDPEEIAASDESGELVITVRGDLDAASAPRLEAEVERRRPLQQPVRFDLSGVTFFDSAAVRALIMARRAALEDGQPPTLVTDASRIVRKVLEVTGLAEAFLSPDVSNGE